MKMRYVMDACALISFLRNEDGAKRVSDILKDATDGTAKILINSINLLEVYYDIYRGVGKAKANEELAMIRRLPVIIRARISDEVFEEAGRLKAFYKISLADSIALAEASVSGGALMTCDHHEFDVVEKKENIRFEWIR